MPVTTPTWEEKKDQLHNIAELLMGLQAQVNAQVWKEIKKIAEAVNNVAASAPGTYSIGGGIDGPRPGGTG